jgi:hypothetical protein
MGGIQRCLAGYLFDGPPDGDDTFMQRALIAD